MDRFSQALIFAAEMHGGQRCGGSPYILHPVAAATKLVRAGGDEAEVAAAPAVADLSATVTAATEDW